jgi:hypothetical protein
MERKSTMLKLSTLAALIMISINPACADTIPIDIGGLTSLGGEIYSSQPLMVNGQQGDTADFGTVILTTPGPSAIFPCNPVADICTVPSIKVAFQAWFGPPPNPPQLGNIKQQLTGFGGTEQCGGILRACDPSGPFATALAIALPANENIITLFFYSWAAPIIIAPSVPLPGTLYLFLAGLSTLYLFSRRRYRIERK